MKSSTFPKIWKHHLREFYYPFFRQPFLCADFFQDDTDGFLLFSLCRSAHLLCKVKLETDWGISDFWFHGLKVKVLSGFSKLDQRNSEKFLDPIDQRGGVFA